MSRITNIYNLPQPFVDLVSGDTYSKGESDITTTGLAQPPKIAELTRRHSSEITMDASEKVWTMMGTANHYVLEQIALRNPERYVTEQRFYLDVDGVKLGGQIDLFDRETETLWDYKVSSVYKAMSDDKLEWTKQANVNKLLCEHNGIHPKKLAVLLVMKDWKRKEAEFKADYPKCAIQEIPLPIWQEAETLAYIKSRINLHNLAKMINNEDEIPVCTEEERWAKPTTWAVLKERGAKRAVNGGLYGSEAEAILHAKRIDGAVEKRDGSNARCENYCQVRKWCNFGRSLKLD
jgi:hypothetical protein